MYKEVAAFAAEMLITLNVLIQFLKSTVNITIYGCYAV